MVKSSNFKIVWDTPALNQLQEILEYLHEQSESAPGIVKQAILAQIKLIQSNPLICESDKLKTPSDSNFRAFIVFSYRVTFQIKPDLMEIRILRIRHTSREPLKY